MNEPEFSGGHFMKYWGGRVPGALQDFYVRAMVGGGGPGACSHGKILKSRVLEMPFLAFWGAEFYQISKVVKYVEDMIFS